MFNLNTYPNYPDRILVLGNGFDLSYKLPTTYKCFMIFAQVVFAKNARGATNIRTLVKDSEKEERRQNKDATCFSDFLKNYGDVISGIKLPLNIIKKFESKLNDNFWYSFFKEKNEPKSWIDFEKEISNVLNLLVFLYDNDAYIQGYIPGNIHVSQERYCEIKNVFSLIDSGFVAQWTSGCLSLQHVDKSELTDDLDGYHIRIHYEKILNVLKRDLNRLSEALSIYLKNIVEVPLNQNKIQLKMHGFLIPPTNVITYNYTNTFEAITNKEAMHLHGEVDTNIVLGINPSSDDSIENIKPMFFPFKKYYQRIALNTIGPYLDLIRSAKMKHEYPALNSGVLVEFFGHSMDITDRDTILQLFDIADVIIVYYYNEESKYRLIANIISMVGKEKCDELLLNKELTFVEASEKNNVIIQKTTL